MDYGGSLMLYRPLQDAVIKSINWKLASFICWVNKFNRLVSFAIFCSLKHKISTPVELIPLLSLMQ